MFRETSSVTLRPVAYSNSSIARSRFPSGVVLVPTNCSKLFISSTERALGSARPTFGDTMFSVGDDFRSPSSIRKAKKDLIAAIFRAMVEDLKVLSLRSKPYLAMVSLSTWYHPVTDSWWLGLFWMNCRNW